MTEGYDALTEKEKETLRLLGDGHDAKSIAQHFGLSVHTINERLRDARRKLAMSSSRGAARMLREMEGTAPKNVRDNPLGGARPGAEMAATDPSAASLRTLRRRAAIIGGSIMTITLALFALSQVATPNAAPAPTRPPVVAVPDARPPAADAARHFLELVDASDWDASWAATGAQFQSLNSVQMWADASRSARLPLGALVSRQMLSEGDVPSQPTIRVVRFRTSFAARADALETISLIWENGAWRVAGIYIE